MISVGEIAPNFDLTSTEDVVIMLRDEVPRSAVLLYLFGDPASDGVRADLSALASAHERLADLPLSVLGISAAKLPELKQAQNELSLPFPLLVDDREFCAQYGVDAADDEGLQPALIAVDRQQRIVFAEHPVGSVEEAIGRIEGDLKRLPGSTSNYPRGIVNRLIDRWVN